MEKSDKKLIGAFSDTSILKNNPKNLSKDSDFKIKELEIDENDIKSMYTLNN